MCASCSSLCSSSPSLGASAAPALAATKRVKVGDNYFVRDGGVPTVTVNKGTRSSGSGAATARTT